VDSRASRYIRVLVAGPVSEGFRLQNWESVQCGLGWYRSLGIRITALYRTAASR
jgi:hypothetical protein